MLLHLGAWRVYYCFGLSGPIAPGPEGGGLSDYSRVRCLRFRGLWYGRFQDLKGPARPCPSLHPFSGDAFGRTPRGSSPISQDPKRQKKPNTFPIPCSPTAYCTIPDKLKQVFKPHERVCIIPKLTNGQQRTLQNQTTPSLIIVRQGTTSRTSRSPFKGALFVPVVKARNLSPAGHVAILVAKVGH